MKLFYMITFIGWIHLSWTTDYVERSIAKTVHDCPPSICGNSTAYRLVHVTATNLKNGNDTIHYIWSCIGQPTILFARVSTVTSISIDWSALFIRNGTGVTFTPDVGSVSGLILSRVLPYADHLDTVLLGDAEVFPDILTDFSWILLDNHSDDSISFQGRSVAHSDATLMFELKAMGQRKRDAHLPHDPVHSNLTQFTFSIQNVPVTIGNTSDIRYALEVLLFRRLSPEAGPRYSTSKSLDDEFTPGIFTFFSLTMPAGMSGAFASWKPVSYVSKDRSRDSQSFAYAFNNVTRIDSGSGDLPEFTGINWTLANSVVRDGIQYYGLNVTVGMSKDGFYAATNFTSWTAMTGVGSPPEESMSPTVLIVIIVGLGTPAVVILFGLFLLLIRKLRAYERRSGYDPIN